MRFALLALLVAIGCGPSSGRDPTGDAGDVPPTPDACQGLECRIVNCEAQGKPPTTISGTVFAPNRTLALYGAQVYVPLSDPGPLQDGVQCTQCSANLPGGSATQAQSDNEGKFTLSNAPSGRNVPVVIQMGKWRRQIEIENVTECTDNPLPAELTALPRNKNEGDIPKIAIATGSCDALECLVRKLGISDSEFTTDAGDGRIHLYASNGANRMASNNASMSAASSLWSNVDKLKEYDIALYSCECSERANEKPQPYMDNLKAYADAGGRVFLSHYHNVWIVGENATHAPAVWPQIATCNTDTFPSGTFLIDQVNNPKGPAFAQWMVNVGASSVLGQVTVNESRQTCTAIDHSRAERWVTLQNGSGESPNVFQFTTPNEVAPGARCGKVVFSDMHVASGSTSSSATPFPGGCSANPLTPQEKALAFMFFDIATCVGVIE